MVYVVDFRVVREKNVGGKVLKSQQGTYIDSYVM
jgi:hypothetical protein